MNTDNIDMYMWTLYADKGMTEGDVADLLATIEGKRVVRSVKSEAFSHPNEPGVLYKTVHVWTERDPKGFDPDEE